MKGVIFTTDAIFALVIVSASISILAYFNYSVQAPYTLTSSYTQAVLNALSSVSVASLSGSSKVAYAILSAHSAGTQDWQQYQGGAARSDYAASGPVLPTILYKFTANAPVSTPIVAGYGNIYFGAGNMVYSLNASYGNTAWTGSPANGIVGVTLYDGLLIYYNSSKIGALYANNGTEIWSYPLPATQVLAYSNHIYAINSISSTSLYIFNARNGTLGSTISTGSNSISIASTNGSIITRLSSGNVLVLTPSGGNVMASTYPFASTNISVMNGVIYTGNGTLACGFYISLAQKFCFSAGSTVTAVAAGNSSAVYEFGSGILRLSATNSLIWSKTMSQYGTSLAYPILTNSSVYSIWSGNYVVDQNSVTGAVMWQAQPPRSYGQVSRFSAAYGNLYVAAGGNIITYGACTSQPYSSVLQTAAQLYLRGSGSCATYLLDYMYPMENYSVFVNNTYAPSLNLASFYNSNVVVYSNPLINSPSTTGKVSVFAWIYLKANPNYGTILSVNPLGYQLGLSSQTTSPTYLRLCISGVSGTCVAESTLPVPFNQWLFVGTTFSYPGNYTFYVNGASTPPASTTGGIGSSSANLSIGSASSGGFFFQGSIADVQVYNTSLSAKEVLQLYAGGIASQPIAHAGNIGWWPLEGDANDYSGYNNTGYPSNVVYSNGNFLPSSYANTYSISVSSVLMPFGKYRGFNGANSIYPENSMLYKVGVYSWK